MGGTSAGGDRGRSQDDDKCGEHPTAPRPPATRSAARSGHRKVPASFRTEARRRGEDGMNFDMERRLRAADPAQSARVYEPSESSIRELLEATMNTATKTPQRPRWIPAVAAAAGVSLVGVATFAVLAGNDDSPTPGGTETTMHLALPSSTAMSSCICLLYTSPSPRD